MQIDFHTLNKLISDKLKTGEPFSAIRIDNTAGYVIEKIMQNQMPDPNVFNERSLVEGGIFPQSVDFALQQIYPRVIKATESADFLGFVDCAQELQKSPLIISKYKDQPTFFSHSFLIMDPGALLGLDNTWGQLSDPPWTSHLKDKKVLVISTHAESIKHQWKNIDKVWGSNREKIAPFELVDCIRSPYHPGFDNRQYPGCNNWLDTVEYIKRLIETYDFDVLLSGASTSSPLYVDHVKKMGKVGIQTGGTIQLFFGLLGYRWTQVEGYKNWHQMYNEHWINPLPIDASQRRGEFMFLETNYAYW